MILFNKLLCAQFVLWSLSSISCLGQKDSTLTQPLEFTYTLDVEPGSIQKLYVTYEIGGLKIVDSFALGKKNRLLRKTIPQPVAAIVYTENKSIRAQPVFLANDTVRIHISDSSIGIAGSQLQEEFLQLTANDRIRPKYFPQYAELSERQDTAGLKNLSALFDSLKQDDVNRAYEYFRSKPSSPLALFAFSRFAPFQTEYINNEGDFSILPDWAKNSPDGRSIAAKIDGSRAAQLNTKARLFRQVSAGGDTIGLEDFKGKFVLLDFWASWCVPCRREHPSLVKLYNQYKDRNFTIISISLDDKRSAWLGAIKQDELVWTNLSDLKGQQNEIAINYGVQAIPANFLLTPQGIIIEKNLNAEQLRQKLEELIGR